MPRHDTTDSRKPDTAGDGNEGLAWLSAPSLLILISLAGGNKHGYAIMQDIAQFSGTRVGPGTLYGAIARLEGRGLVAGVESTDRRRPYRLTPRGRALLDARLQALGDLLDTAVARSAA